MRGLRTAAAVTSCVLAAYACSGAAFVDSLPDAAECAWAFEQPVAVEGESGLTATYDCPDPRGCAGKAFLPGMALTVGIELPALSSSDFEVLVEQPGLDAFPGPLSLERDPCADQAIASGSITLGAPGATTLIAMERGEPIDSWTFVTRRPSNVELERAHDGGDYATVAELALEAGAETTLRALAFDSDGDPLVTLDAAFWVDDAQIAGLGDDDEPALRAMQTRLRGKRTGSTELHVLVSHVERSFPLIVTAH